MDPRDREAIYGSDYKSFDEKRMVLVYEIADDEWDEVELVFPAKFEVCGLCDGKGRHVNPSIDAHGISAEEFYEDPDFAESYMSGMYDETCYRCGGKRVEPVINEEYLSEEQKENLKKLNDYLYEMAKCRAEDERTMRGEMGYY